MKRTFVVAAREITERRTLLIAALVAGLLPFASPLFPGVRNVRWAEARDAMALVLAAAFGAGSALLLGATVVGRDLAEGRLSFDFSRPLSAGSIWGGRFLGAIVVTLLVLTLVLLPATIAGGGVRSTTVSPLDGISLLFLAGLLFLIPLAHVAGVAFRSRSGWLGVDMVCAVTFLLTVGAAARRLFDGFALQLLSWSLLVVVALTVPALWIASALQVSRGRTDLRAGHRAQSLSLWVMLLSLAGAYFGYTSWVASAGPADLMWAWSDPAPSGPWTAISGRSPGRGDYETLFLLDAAGLRSIRLGGAGGPAYRGRTVLFSGDGRRAAWLRAGGPSDLHADVFSFDLTRPDASPRDTRVSFPGPSARGLALSDDGARLAALDGETLSVHDLGAGKTLVSAKLPGEPHTRSWPALFFAAPDRVRVVVLSKQLEIYEMNVSARTIEKTGEAELPEQATWLSWIRATDRLFVGTPRSTGPAALLDARTGALVRSIERGQSARWAFRLLEDGRIVASEKTGDEARIRVLDRDGLEIRTIELGRREHVILGGEAAAGKLVVVSAPGDGARIDESSAKVLLIDLASGESRDLATGLVPEQAGLWSFSPPAAGSVATRLFRAGNSVVYLDPLTGEQKTVAGSRK